MALSACSELVEPTMTVPSFSTSTVTLHSSMIERMVLPPGPIRKRIFSGSILMGNEKLLPGDACFSPV